MEKPIQNKAITPEETKDEDEKDEDKKGVQRKTKYYFDDHPPIEAKSTEEATKKYKKAKGKTE